jgi:oxygen-dependent protoporphyrinogen oxidase
VTLVLDAPELDSAPRGPGVLTTGNVTRAKALTHSTAKWPWLAARAKGRHVVRLSYALDSPEESVIGYAVGDAARLLGIAIETWQVRAATQVVWPDAAPVQVDRGKVPKGVELVGSAAGLTGLAAIVAAELEARQEWTHD